ncbi:MAG: thioesterase family protein [Anaerolineales bacterium]|nr:thioesterase family protein [Anaerolineales bacterium]
MAAFRFYHPLEVRYGDLDPQGHLNNAKYMTYMEQGRISYLKHLGLWESGSFLDLGIILADAHLVYRAAVHYGDPLRVGVRISRLGNKSMDMLYILENPQTAQEYASGSSVLVAYDYHRQQSILIPDLWRNAISAFEEIPLIST